MAARKPVPRTPDDAALSNAIPNDPSALWKFSGSADGLTPPPFDETPVLKTLGPLPFARGGFPIMGFLATLYEHVSRHARDMLDAGKGGV